MYGSDERSTSVKMAVEDMDAMLCSSLRHLKPGTASFEYRMIHKCDKKSPYCIYMLYHVKTEAASKAPLNRFSTLEGDNGWKVVGNADIVSLKTAVPSDPVYKSLFNNFLSTESFVPAQLVHDVQQHSSWIANEQDAILAQMKKKVASGDATAVDLMMEMMEMLAFPSIRTVSEKLALVLTHTTKPEKEVELNQLQYQIIKNDLSNLGFMVKTSIDQNDFCMFRKSLPDLYFYKDHSGNIVKAGLLKICSNEFEEICTVGGVVEFKIGSDVKKFYQQMFADMVRLGCYLTTMHLSVEILLTPFKFLGCWRFTVQTQEF